MKNSILLVDDEESVLKSVRRQLMSADYEVYVAASGSEGLNLLTRQEVNVIISDMRMPEMDGVSFLREAAIVCPHAVRMILSGYAEVGSILAAVNQGHVWRYITKPWKEEDLRLAIRNAMDLWSSENERRELVARLEHANAELEVLNAGLEDKVRERTWELSERTDILHLILEDKPVTDVTKRCRNAMAHILGHNDVYLQNVGSILEPGAPPPEEAVAAHTACASRCEPVSKNGWLALPLARSGIHLGEVVLRQGGRDMNEIIASLDSMALLLAMALGQYRMVASAPQLMGHIDRLLGEIPDDDSR